MNILITGGTSGIGRCVVERLTKEGHAVAFVGRNEERGREVAQSTGATFIDADISTAAECERVANTYFTHFDHCDILINNAGLWTQGNLVDTPIKEIEDVFAINTLAPIILTRVFLEHIEKAVDSGTQKSARIIFVNSMAGLKVNAQRSVYFASKWAITGFARSLAVELGSKDIAVTNVCPGYINTELFDHGGYPRDASDALEPAYVADTIAYIISLPAHVQIGDITIKPTKYS